MVPKITFGKIAEKDIRLHHRQHSVHPDDVSSCRTVQAGSAEFTVMRNYRHLAQVGLGGLIKIRGDHMDFHRLPEQRLDQLSPEIEDG